MNLAQRGHYNLVLTEFVRDEARYVERAVKNTNGYIAYVQGSNALKMAKTFLYPPARPFPEEVATFFAYFIDWPLEDPDTSPLLT